MVCLTGAAALVDLFKGLLTKDDPNNLNITVDSAKSGKPASRMGKSELR